MAESTSPKSAQAEPVASTQEKPEQEESTTNQDEPREQDAGASEAEDNQQNGASKQTTNDQEQEGEAEGEDDEDQDYESSSDNSDDDAGAGNVGLSYLLEDVSDPLHEPLLSIEIRAESLTTFDLPLSLFLVSVSNYGPKHDDDESDDEDFHESQEEDDEDDDPGKYATSFRTYCVFHRFESDGSVLCYSFVRFGRLQRSKNPTKKTTHPLLPRPNENVPLRNILPRQLPNAQSDRTVLHV